MWCSTGSSQIKKDLVYLPPRPVQGKKEEGLLWFSVCEALLDIWANGGPFDVFFTYGEYGFSYKGSLSYSK